MLGDDAFRPGDRASAGRPVRMLVVGASGLVGSELTARARSRGWDVVGAARTLRGEASRVLDLAERDHVGRTLAELHPDTVAICAAWPWVDGCEMDPARSHRENVRTVMNLIDATRGSDVKLVFYSTDHVFDGSAETYVESDPVRPLSVYARHKRQVEELLLERGNALIIRTSYVFGVERAGKNFMYQVIRAATAGTSVKVPARQGGCPTWSGWLTASTLSLHDDGVEGLVHLTGMDPLTKAQWARLIIDRLELPPCEVIEVPWSEAGQVAPRPERVVLRTTRHSLVQPHVAAILDEERASFLSMDEAGAGR